MKKSTKIILFTFLLVALISSAYASIITGDIITGKAASQQTTVSLVVDNDYPYLYIVNPENRSGNQYPYNLFNLNNLSLNYTAFDPTTPITGAWYNINNGENISIPITTNTTILAPNGTVTLNLFVNDSVNHINTTSTIFEVNASIGWFAYITKYNGASTNLTLLTIQGKEAMQNISNLTLEISDHGKIVFNEPINISRNIVQFASLHSIIDDYSTIYSSNVPAIAYVYINPDMLPEFNKSATIYLYNLSLYGTNIFSDPRIRKDGEPCSSPDCTINSYTNGTLIFTVAEAGALYQIEETTATEGGTTTTIVHSSGGGGTRTVTTEVYSESKIVPDKTELLVSLKQGETKKEYITITNTDDETASLILLSPNIPHLLKISETAIVLEPGESKLIEIDFIAPEDIAPQLYLGTLDIQGKTKRQIFLAVDIESKHPLMDVKTEIPSKFLEVAPGEEIYFTAFLYSLGKEGKFDTSIEYKILSQEGELIFSEHETIAVETQTSFVKSIKLPENIKEGKYILYISATYNNERASSSSFFEVTTQKTTSRYSTALLIILIMFVISIITYFTIYVYRKNNHNNENTSSSPMLKNSKYLT